MRFISLIVITSFCALPAVAHEGHHPCAAYFAKCKDGTDKAAKMKCVHDAAAADGDNGKACVSKMEEHKK